MRKILNSIIIASALLCTSCEWLDINPESGLDETEVFTIWDNYKSYFEYVYGNDISNTSTSNLNLKLGYPLYLDNWSLRFTWLSMTDICDSGRLIRAQTIKSGTMGANTEVFTTDESRRPISKAMFKIIRICNKAIENIDRVQNMPSQEDYYDILGQAYFVRAYAHFVLCRYFGGMPYLDHALEADDSWDLPRLSSHETYVRCAEDFDTAYEYLLKAGKIRRDGTYGSANHLTAPDQDRPNGVAAKGMKARALLYAASPLSNEHGTADWDDAATACAEALQIALDNGYELMSLSLWQTNFISSKYTNEHIWAWHFGSSKTSNFTGMYTYSISNGSTASGDCPTQNFVDRFETIYGEPLTTEEERAEATAAGHYNEQNMYADRDPRLDLTVLHDQSVTAGCKCINMYYDPDTKSYPTTTISGASSPRLLNHTWGEDDSKGYTNTGYMVNKWWDGNFQKQYLRSDPLIRLAELYLNYAEAVNEAYGPQGKAGETSLTAVDAINKVRARAGMPDVLSKFTGDKDSFRERIQNERIIELAFEGHHYYLDIRRWKIAPQTMTQTLMGIYVEKTDVSGNYPAGRIYERRSIPSNRQSDWKDAMYYIPFPTEEMNKMKNFTNNEAW